MNDKSLKGDLTVGNVGKKLILFAIPVAIANLVQALYNLADMAIVGHFVGSAGMSAVTMGGLTITVVRIAFVWIFDAFTEFGFLGIAWAYVFAPIASLIASLIFLISGRWKKSTVKLS